MELTKEHFDQAIKGLATQQSVDDLASRVTTIEKTLSQHTSALEKLLTKKKTKDDENTVSAERFKRIEDWAVQVGQKLGIKLEV
jgi:hypothetical protein